MRYVSPPPGFKDYLPKEVEKIRLVEDTIRKVSESFGYKEVITPTLEYADVIQLGTNTKDDTILYKVIDRDGALLSIRPEFTTSIARLVTTRYRDGKGPFRFYYIGKVFRNIQFQPLMQKEFTQGGAELIGESSLFGDIEIISLIEEIFERLNLPIHIEVSHARIIPAIIEATSPSILDAIKAGDFVSIKSHINNKNILSFVEELPFLSGGKDVIEEAQRYIRYIPGLKEPLEQLSKFISNLEDLGYKRTKINLGVIRDFEYYTGITFEGYIEGLGLPVVGGGRYDGLLERFGVSLPATGFAIGIERVAGRALKEESEPDLVIGYTEEKFKEAMNLAQIKRKEGLKVEIVLCSKESDLVSRSGRSKIFLC
ncbi:MAG: ATP phosphoribosyltransferase regulatory subunit [bacterium]|nr:ATP phosphoribosyltransferase regulatory subunit [bacterium]